MSETMLVKIQLNTKLTFVPLSSSAPVVWIIQILVCPRNSTEILVCLWIFYCFFPQVLACLKFMFFGR